MAALLLLYCIHPTAGWTTLTVLFVGTVVARRRKANVAVRE
jgi:CBS-domain-containing membrane protein